MTHDPLHDWKRRIIDYGLFVLFVVTFGDYVLKKVWSVVGGLFRP